MRRMMAALKTDLRNILRWRILLYAFVSAILFVTLKPHAHRTGTGVETVYLGLMGGFAYEEIIALSLNEVFIWTLLGLTYLIGVLDSMQAEYEGRCRDTLYRFRSYRSWYLSKALAGAISCLVISALMSLGVLLGAVAWGAGACGGHMGLLAGSFVPAWQLCLLAFIMLTFNMVMLTQWQMLIHLVTGSVVAATAAFVLPILLNLYAASNTYLDRAPLYNPINWGMLYRSNLFSDPGFSLPIALTGQLGIALLCFLAAFYASSHVNLAGRTSLNR